LPVRAGRRSVNRMTQSTPTHRARRWSVATLLAALALGLVAAGGFSAASASQGATPVVTRSPYPPVHPGNILCARVSSRELTMFWQVCPPGHFWVQIDAQDLYWRTPRVTGSPTPTLTPSTTAPHTTTPAPSTTAAPSTTPAPTTATPTAS